MYYSQLSKLGEIEIKLHRDIDGEKQRINIRKKPTCKWFAYFLVKLELTSDIPKIGLSVGVDVDIKSFLTQSSGQYVPKPRFFVIDEKLLVKAQMKLAKAPKGTAIKAKALKLVEHIHERISNKREDFVQK
jgi:putative transposase